MHVTPANDKEGTQRLREDVQQATDHWVKLGWADQGYAGEVAAEAARNNDIDLQIVKLPEAKKGFVLLPRRWVVRAQLRLAGEIPQTHAGLRAPTRSARRAAYPGLCRAHVAHRRKRVLAMAGSS